jgi:hypothetical protein
MDANEIRETDLYACDQTSAAANIQDVGFFLREIAAQLAELNAKTLSKREQIAVAAIAATIQRAPLINEVGVITYCQDAYIVADATLKASEGIHEY